MNPNFEYSDDPPSYQASYGPAAPDSGPVGPQTGPVGPQFYTGPVPTEKSYQNHVPAFSTIPQQEIHYDSDDFREISKFSFLKKNHENDNYRANFQIFTNSP